MKTWKAEVLVAAAVLAAAALAGGARAIDALSALAVLATFCHVQVAERLRENHVAAHSPREIANIVHCHHWLTRYLVAKELLWVAFFVATRSWPALAGCGLFLLYPVWRRWWRNRHPRRV